MKKHNIIALIGVLALTANLLIPGLAFGQTQTGTLGVDCPTPGGTSAPTPPGTVTFDTVTASSSAQSSYDSAVDDDTELPSSNLLSVVDADSGGVDGCQAGNGFYVEAAVTSDCDDGAPVVLGLCHGVDPVSYNIPASSMLIITTDENVDLLGLSDPVDAGTATVDRATTTGNETTGTDIVSDVDYTADDLFETAATYSTYGDPLSAAVTVLDSSGIGWNGTVYTGVAIAIIDGIAAYQAQGTYTGTITYSLTST
jgi:hypothetical protein